MKQQADDNLQMYGFLSEMLKQANISIIEETNIIEEDDAKLEATGV